MPMKRKIGLIAGNGQLPQLVASNIRAAGHRVIAIGHLGETQKDLQKLRGYPEVGAHRGIGEDH